MELSSNSLSTSSKRREHLKQEKQSNPGFKDNIRTKLAGEKEGLLMSLTALFCKSSPLLAHYPTAV